MASINLPPERRVGHLTLHRQGRKLSLKEFNALSSSERLEIIHQAQGKQKYDLLLNAVDAEQLVPQLHPQELYLTVNQLGPEYSSELLMLASAEQTTTLLDLDCWNDDSLSPVLSLHWLELLLATGPEKVCQLAREIEPELLVLFLKKHLRIIRGLEAYDDDEAENARRLEALYDVEYASEDAAKIIGALLQILMQQEQECYLLLMEMIRSEIISVLEEEVYQGRNNRLLDLGIIPAAEARALYSYLDPQTFTPGGKEDFRLEADDMQHPGALLAQATPENLLEEVLSTSINHSLAVELSMLANRKMSADQVDISSAEAISAALQSLYRTLNLALEALAGKDLPKAEQIFKTTYLQRLYQYGYSLLRKRQIEAEQLAAGPIGKLLDYPEQLFIDSLRQKPPYLYQEARDDRPSQLQEISTLSDLALVDRRLAQIRQLQDLFTRQLPFDLPEEDEFAGAELSLTSLFLTAIANQLLGRPFAPAPLTIDLLPELCEKSLQTDDLQPGFHQDVHQLVDSLCPGCEFFSQFCLECWFEELTAYRAEPESYQSSWLQLSAT